MQAFGPGASHSFSESNPAQDDIPEDQAQKNSPEKEYDTSVPRSIHGWDYSTQAAPKSEEGSFIESGPCRYSRSGSDFTSHKNIERYRGADQGNDKPEQGAGRNGCTRIESAAIASGSYKNAGCQDPITNPSMTIVSNRNKSR